MHSNELSFICIQCVWSGKKKRIEKLVMKHPLVCECLNLCSMHIRVGSFYFSFNCRSEFHLRGATTFADAQTTANWFREHIKRTQTTSNNLKSLKSHEKSWSPSKCFSCLESADKMRTTKTIHENVPIDCTQITRDTIESNAMPQ